MLSCNLKNIPKCKRWKFYEKIPLWLEISEMKIFLSENWKNRWKDFFFLCDYFLWYTCMKESFVFSEILEITIHKSAIVLWPCEDCVSSHEFWNLILFLPQYWYWKPKNSANMKITFLDYSWKISPLSLSLALNGAFFLFFLRLAFSVCCVYIQKEKIESMRKINEKIRCIRENSLGKEERNYFLSRHTVKVYCYSPAVASPRHILITSCLENIEKSNC